jgi:hypothetical protein
MEEGMKFKVTPSYNSMIFWYPITLQFSTTVPMPRSRFYFLDPDKIEDIHNNMFVSLEELDAIKEILEKEFDFPNKNVFMRTDLCSGKHDYDSSCLLSHIKTPDNSQVKEQIDKNAWFIARNIHNLLEYNALADQFYQALVFREFLSLESTFKTFTGNLPIAKERRYFVRDSKVICYHPYWPKQAIQDWLDSSKTGRKNIPVDWQFRLNKLNEESEEEVAILSNYATALATGLCEYHGFWSIDFCKTVEGKWYFIDCAMGELSWHAEDCPNTFNIRI